jgi:hypothetical protein
LLFLPQAVSPETFGYTLLYEETDNNRTNSTVTNFWRIIDNFATTYHIVVSLSREWRNVTKIGKFRMCTFLSPVQYMTTIISEITRHIGSLQDIQKGRGEPLGTLRRPEDSVNHR